MNTTTIGIILIVVGAFAFGISLLKPPNASMAGWRRWRIMIGGPVAIVLGILVLTGVIGG